jgi:hypothetical protein
MLPRMDRLENNANAEHPVPAADLAKLDDADLKAEIHRLTRREREISFQRRYLHGQIEVARAELMRRLTEAGPGDLSAIDVEELNRILSDDPPRGDG